MYSSKPDIIDTLYYLHDLSEKASAYLKKGLEPIDNILHRDSLHKSELIILNLTDAIMTGGGIYPVIKRQGLDDFLEEYSDKDIVIYTTSGSDFTHDSVLKDNIELFKQLKIGVNLEKLNEISEDKAIKKVYFGWDMNDNDSDLDAIRAEFNIADPARVVIIDDSTRYKDSARKNGMGYIRVPMFIDEIEGLFRRFYTDKTISPEDYKSHYDEILENKKPRIFSFRKLI